MSPNATPGRGPEAAGRERIWTPALLVFLAAVLCVLLFAAHARFRVPTVREAAALLADGDADGEERDRLLRGVVAGSLQSEVVTERWAGLLAAVALGDRDAYAALLARLGAGPAPSVLPPAADRDLLHLGDAMLGHALSAWVAEAEGAAATARLRWRQIAAQSRLIGRPFAGELAAAALGRLP